MDTLRRSPMVPFVMTLFGAAIILAGASVALARTFSGPPFAQPTPQAQPTDTQQTLQKVQTFFSAVPNQDCATAFLGQADLQDDQTVAAFGALVDGLQAGQTSHMVQSVRMLLQNCADHPNDGLMNALSHHGLNWVRHYDQELWLEQKFAAKWPDGKPGKAGKPDHATTAEKVHGNPHDTAGAKVHGHGSDTTAGS
jgi:hypothetical protein